MFTARYSLPCCQLNLMKCQTFIAMLAGIFAAPLFGQTNASPETPSKPDAPVAEATNSTTTAEKSDAAGSHVYVVPVHGVISEPLTYVVRRCVKQAVAEKADAIVFEIDSPGGTVLHTEEILNHIIEIPIPTYAFVTNLAFSGGAMLAVGCDKIYMTRGSRLGGAVVVQPGQGGGYETMGDAERAKMESYFFSFMQYVAERKNRDPDLVKAMIVPKFEYRIGDTVVSPAGDVLTVNNITGEKLYKHPDGVERPLISLGTVSSVSDMLQKEGFKNPSITEMQVAPAEKLARFLSMLAPALIGIGIMLIYLEIQNPGFGVLGLTGIALLLVFFSSSHIAGLAGMEEVVLFFLGLVLLAVEVLILPGFGIPGLLGIACIMGALVSAMITRYPRLPGKEGEEGTPPLNPEVFDSFSDFSLPLAKVSAGIIIAGIGIAWAVRALPRSRVFASKLILDGKIEKKDGFNSAAERDGIPVGAEGIALSELRPGGNALINDKILDVLTQGEFLAKDTPVRVVESRGNRVVVEAFISGDNEA